MSVMAVRIPGSSSRALPQELCHLTVQGGRKRVDLALPATVPIVELTPVLATLCQVGPARNGRANGRGHGTPPAWSLARPGGPPLELTETLAQSGVLDGEVLHLVDVSTWRAPVVSDVVDAVTGALENHADRWPGEAGRRLLAGLCGACLVAAGAVAAGAGVLVGPGAVLTLLLAAVLGCLAVVPALLPRRPATRAALAVGAVALAALASGGLAGGTPGEAVPAAAAGAAIAMVAVYAALPAVAPGGVLVAVVLAVGAAAVVRGAAPAAVAAIAAVAGVIALRLWPPVVSAVLSALVPPSMATAEAAVRRSRGILASLSGATSLILLGAALTLLADGSGFAMGLAVASGVALALRARTYRLVPEALPPALAAGAGLVLLDAVAAWRLLVPHGQAGLAVFLLVATGLALAALSLLPMRLPAPGRGVRLLWLAVDLAIGPLAFGTLGGFELLARLVHHFLH